MTAATIIGFTGTRAGPTPQSHAAFIATVMRLQPRRFLHGACRGWDAEAAKIVSHLFPTCDIIAFPGISANAWPGELNPDRDQDSINLSHHVMPEVSHFARNREIVRLCTVLVACPPTLDLAAKGGTIYTLNYARKCGKPTVTIAPDGVTYDSLTPH